MKYHKAALTTLQLSKQTVTTPRRNQWNEEEEKQLKNNTIPPRKESRCGGIMLLSG
jgi:hypothetical protein